MTTRLSDQKVQADPDRRAREVEEQMTDEERFSLLISALGTVPGSDAAGTRDPHIPDDVNNMSAGYTPAVPRLGIPAIQSSDASMGVTNPATGPTTRVRRRSRR